MKVALVLLPEYSPDFPYLGQGYLAAALRQAGHIVSVFDYNLETHATLPAQRDWLWSKDTAQTWTIASTFFGQVWPHIGAVLRRQLERLLDGGFDIIAFSVFDTNQHGTHWMIRQLRARRPNVKIIVGGPSSDTSQFRLADNYGLIDALVRGEGEVTLVELVGRAAQGLRLRNAPGTVFGPAQPPFDMADLPIPDFSDLTELPYASAQQPIQFSRGCPCRCAFCTERTLWSGFRTRTPGAIVEEMSTRHRQSGVENFIVVDALLNADPRWLMELTDRIRESRINICWGGNLRVNPKMTRGVFGRLREAGFAHTVLGVESGSKHVLGQMNKGINPATSLRNVRDCSKVGIITIINILVGFHGESQADFEMTCQLVARMWRHIDGMNLSRFWPGDGFDWSIPEPVPTERGDERKAVLEPAVAYLVAETEARHRVEQQLIPLLGVTRARSLALSHLRRNRPALESLCDVAPRGRRASARR